MTATTPNAPGFRAIAALGARLAREFSHGTLTDERVNELLRGSRIRSHCGRLRLYSTQCADLGNKRAQRAAEQCKMVSSAEHRYVPLMSQVLDANVCVGVLRIDKSTKFRGSRRWHALVMLVTHWLDVIRNRRLQQTRMRDREERLYREANTAHVRDTFLATISHEVRTPLNVIVGTISMVTREMENIRANETVLKQMERVTMAGGQLLELIQDVLDFSTLRAHAMTLSRNAFDLRRLLRETMLIHGNVAESKNLIYEMHVDDAVPQTFIGDRKRLGQIVTNLLSNAMKFTARGSIVMHVRGKPSLPDASVGPVDPLAVPNWTLVFEIQDTGCGVDPSNHQRIFDVFEQAPADGRPGAPESTLDGTTRGTGLGLAICKNLVSLMNGHIWVESAGSGHGSKFSFTVVLEESVEIERMFEANREMLADKHVLVVDDTADNRILLMEMLAAWDCVPYVCSSAEEALRYLGMKHNRIDVAILDVHMPDRSGVDLAHQMLDEWPGIPTVGLSSIDGEVPGRDVFDVYETKPVEEHVVMRALCRALSLGKRTQQPQQPQQPQPVDRVMSLGGSGSPLRTRARSGSSSTSDASLSPRSGRRARGRAKRMLVSRRRHRQPKKVSRTRVMLVEDDPATTEMTLNMLREMGYTHINTAENGARALELLDEVPHDVVLMDLKMPVMNGLECARHIRRRFSEAERPTVVALTASAMMSDQDKCREAGMDGHISKPITWDALRVLMERIHSNSGESLWD